MRSEHHMKVIQNALFEITRYPDGFLLQPDFLTVDEEDQASSVIHGLPFKEFSMRGVVAKRRSVHFGLGYAFTSHRLSPAPAIPEELEFIRDRAAVLAGVNPTDFAETLVIEYQPGAGIGWHRDAPPFGIIAGISLAGRCRMRFRKGSEGKSQTIAVELPSRSIYLLTGSSRKAWQHSIPAVAETRYSITFRTLRNTLVPQP